MSRASIRTKLPLATFFRIFGLHPLHANQVEMINDPHCDHIIFQHEWQTADAVSREEIAQAILIAESKIEQYLGYHLLPTWEVDEWRPTIRPYAPEMWNSYSSDVRGYKQTVKANWGYFISGGIEAKTVIDDAVAIVWSDPDGDGYFERGTVTVLGTVSNKDEVCIFYPGHSGDDAWEIRPIEVVISGANIIITFRRELVIAERFYDMFDVTENSSADALDDADFLEEVDVYRRYNDPQTQANFLWEPLAGGYCSVCSGVGCSTCAYATQAGCLIVRGDPRQSIVGYAPATWNNDDDVMESASWVLGRQPDIVRLYYYSGWRQKRLSYTNRMDPEWEYIVAHMAAAQLDRPPCGCAKGNWERWRQDLTIVSGIEDGMPRFREPGSGINVGGIKGITDNPFGTRRGEVEAWRKVKDLKIGTAAVL